MRPPAQNAELALLLEVSGTPKPGNVDRRRNLSELRYEHFLAGAVGARDGLRMAEHGAALGAAFERAVAGMSAQRGGNTQFGALLLLVPLTRAAGEDLSPPVLESILEGTTVADAADFYRAFEHVDVGVGEPPEGLEALDVRRGSDAIPDLEERGLTLLDVMDRSAPVDDVAREWVTGFERSFIAAERITDADGPATDRAAVTFLSLLAERPDTFVAKRHDEGVAREVTDRAADLYDRDALDRDPEAVEDFADELVSRGINPGTTADLTAAGLFIALEHDTLEI
ncbi:triphosphoribosyl-dephospho-CoA synthase [Natrialbaceae archaeon AArc-T1-2]|uniref:triphosphoribosyl-dephospho-CoA synthase n=1 Tax=Natrialbaceae archaeon AArc-T1-2 TaxID=3053904 RepID=UPI00255B352C|nr:triphosphoribosyl-dephospho-CoA synthase [Natrialbaceae archaeon AArc-T1-2]WIV67661.1 triphosphoribosyl-dephospho-CoA synthase [Natrialbaceae archaeon AArc-T1-2]